MNIRRIIIFPLALVLLSFGLPKKIHKKISKEIQAAYQIDQFDLEAVIIDAQVSGELPSTFNGNNFFEIRANEEFLGYAYIAKAPSMTDEFDYMVLFDTDLIIVKSKVLIYREDYGSEIGSKRWLKQFNGKSQDDSVRYGENIAAISGATISVKSMTLAINNLLRSIKILHHKNII